jgi:tetratricopeptide (TPR) repeat protein
MQRIIGPYYYGKRKWDNYLLDIQETVAAGNLDNSRRQGEALEVAHEQLSELRMQTEHLSDIKAALNSGFEALRAEFEWGFTLMVERMDAQIKLLSEVTEELRAIHRTLKSPLSTQFNELFQRGEIHNQEQLWDKALKDFLDAEKYHEVHPLLQLKIGQLYLYGRNSSCNVIDLPQAEAHLLAAARYADAKKEKLSKWSEICGQAYFHAAVAAYLIGEQAQAAGLRDSMRACLERALGYLAKAAVLWPRFTEIVYTQAKCHALLGQTSDAEQKLEILSDRDRRYFAKASQDGDFKTFRGNLEQLFERATISPGPKARATMARIDDVAQAVTWAKRSAPASIEDVAAIESSERELARARRVLPTLDVDIEDLSERLSLASDTLEKIALRSFQRNLDASQQSVASCEGDKISFECSIESLKQTMKGTSGAGLGCAFAPVFFVGTIVLASSFPKELVEHNMHIVTIISVIMTAAGAVTGSSLSRSFKNQPHERQIEEKSRAISECVKKLPSLKKQVETWKQEMRSFAAWQAQRSASSPARTFGG